MIPHEPRTLGYYANAHWLQAATLFVVIGSMAMGLLWALSDAKERAEKLLVELTVRNMRTGMQLAMGEALMQQRAGEVASWVGSNPVLWLGSSPEGYRGECSAAESQGLSGGEWCFERERRELVYRPYRTDRLRAQPEDSGRQCEQLRWRVVRSPEGVAGGGFVGLRMEVASPCQWVLE